MERISLWLYRKGFIAEKDIDYMRYALELIMSEYVVTFIVYMVLCFCGYWIEASVHLILFTYLRKILDGYHASTIVRCAIISTIVFILGTIISLNEVLKIVFLIFDLTMCLYYMTKESYSLKEWLVFIILCVVFILVFKIRIIDTVIFTIFEVAVLKVLKEVIR